MRFDKAYKISKRALLEIHNRQQSGSSYYPSVLDPNDRSTKYPQDIHSSDNMVLLIRRPSLEYNQVDPCKLSHCLR